MKSARRIVLCVGSVVALAACYVHGTSISITRADPKPTFTQREQDTAKTIVIQIGRAAGFWETDVAEKLAGPASSRPYLWFVSLGAPGGSPEQRSVSISGEMRSDRREIRVSVADSARGEPLPSTRQMIEDLRVALERAFPDCHVEVTSRRKLHLLAP